MLTRQSKFENGEVTVRIYQRHHDCRVHFFLRTHQPHKRPKIYMVSLTSLIVTRHGSILKFEKLDHGVERDWANLRFRTYEGEASHFTVLPFFSQVFLVSNFFDTPKK